MASTISSITQSLVDSKVVPALRNILPLLQAFSFRPEKTPKIQDDVVYVPVATDPTAQSKTAGTAVTGNGTVAGVSITLSNFYAAGWDANEGKMSAELLPAYWADKAAGAVYSLAKQVIDAALATVTAAHFGNAEGTDKLTCAAADFGQSDIALLWQYAEAKIKQQSRVAMFNTPFTAQIIDSTALTFATAGNNILSNGQLPTLVGMNTMYYAGVPTNSENLAGAVIGRAAIGVAVAPPEALMGAGDGDIIESRIITDPESGISVLYRTSAAYGGNYAGECSLLYGVDKIQDAVVRLVTA